MSSLARPLLVLVVLAALIGLASHQLANPAPAPADAPADQFSAARAIATLRATFVDAPHPIATPAHDAVRDRIVAALRALDYDVHVEHVFACNAGASCGAVDNVIARVPGAPPGKAVLVAAHYDSVPAGPGASDDGVGVASVLEVARAIRREAFAHPVELFLDDGEEPGLLGAEGYVADRARSRDAAFVINLEARGTSGTPFLFETSREQRWLIPIVARALPHPISSSLFATIYDLLPNDTDLTVFKRAGVAGINFAHIGDGTQYHTPLDDLAHVDAGAVQRRGEQVLAMVRAFAGAGTDLDAAAPGPAVWFDAFALVLVWWPAGATWVIVGAAWLALAIALVRGRRRAALGLPGVVLGMASFVVSLVLAGALGVALGAVLGHRAPGALFEPYPQPALIAAWLLGAASAIAAAGLARRWASFDGVLVGHAIGWNLFAIALAGILPGAAYLAVVPGLVLALGALARQIVRFSDVATCLLALVAAACVLLPILLIGHDALGAPFFTAACVLVGLLATTFSPVLAATWRSVVAACVGLAIVAAGVAFAVPRHTASHPAQLALAHVTDADTGAARWQTSEPTPLVAAAAGFAPSRAPVLPWYGARGTADVAPAPAVGTPAPTVTVRTTPVGPDGTRTIAIDAASQRNAPRIAIAWHSDAELVALRVNGTPLPPRPARFRSYYAPGWSRVFVRGGPAHLELVVRGAAPGDARISDTTFGL
ncbi:MAG TPA: M28 family peptidase, partial [Kofleriaceae bacterium]|nr:M28 family peptidase [Kofleriaceae bacterium]